MVVGAGPTGVELTGEIATLAHRVLPKDFRNISTREAQVILMDAGPTILPRFPSRCVAGRPAICGRSGVDDMDEGRSWSTSTSAA